MRRPIVCRGRRRRLFEDGRGAASDLRSCIEPHLCPCAPQGLASATEQVRAIEVPGRSERLRRRVACLSSLPRRNADKLIAVEREWTRCVNCAATCTRRSH
jgi:hypothetical protein